MTSNLHVPVMLDRVVALLEPAVRRPGAVLVDATLGLGGHAEAVLDRCPDVRLIGLDRDPVALKRARDRLARFGSRVETVHAIYDQLPAVLTGRSLRRVQGILFDLGVSSLQLDDDARGFAYARNAPLDMRMDPTVGQTAADVLNTYSAADLARVLRDYGEERFARKIAAAIVRERQREPFSTSGRLVELLRQEVPAASQRSGGHPAKRTFQALRIEVNGELAALERALPSAVEAIDVGGRIVVLSYHSLEDRLAKRVFAASARSTAPRGLPVELPEHRPALRLITRGAEVPDAAEVATNSRAASAKLRAAERLREAA
ncbi:MAG TPA: 16S rRNA (cytosine(1402)-N(4))-methyltransferase RsmH [Jiangellaceae bacterium]